MYQRKKKVINMEDWLTIKNLKKKQPALSNRKIAEQLGISHNTVKAALEKKEFTGYKRKPGKTSALEPFREVIFEMANLKKFKGSRILSEVRSKGYKGSQTAFYDYLTKIQIGGQKHFTPYETDPGEQAQFDWSPYTVVVGGELSIIYIYSYINSFSRYMVLEVSLSQNQGAIFDALENSMIESGGICQRLQTDNAKSFVQNASKDNFQWNLRYLNFCAHYGITPTRSLPGHPWSKGKVERPFSYIENHFIAGSIFEDFPDLQNKLKLFQGEMNKKFHSTIKTSPAELFEKEKLSLLALPDTRYIGVKEENRKVSFDCLVSYNGSRYSVPWVFAGKLVWIKISQGYYFQAYSQANKMIAKHKLSLKKGSVVILQEHYKNSKVISGSLELLGQKFLEKFPCYALFLEKLQAQKRFNSYRQLDQILSLSGLYKKDDFEEALNKALEYNVFNHSFISGYLEKNHKQSFKIEQVKTKMDLPKDNIKRDLSQYKLF